MSGIAGIIYYDGTPVERHLLDKMTSLIRHRGPDGLRCEIRGQAGLGHALLAMSETERVHKHPVWTSDGSCGIVADARLYNRDELMNWLYDVRWLGDDPSDAALILAAYERWGIDLLQKLDGDFAFVIWNGETKQIFAARDPFGAKPLIYRHEANRFLFGSEAKQILTMPGVPLEVDDIIVGEYLFSRFEDPNRTFFEGVKRILPAHWLLVQEGRLKQVRYWNPDPENETFYSNTQDYYDHFRNLLKKAVQKRLQSDYPITVELSGGLDSSSIAVLAGAVYQETKQLFPPLTFVSAVFPGFPCDESDYQKAVLRQQPFSQQAYNPLSGPMFTGLESDIWQMDAPYVDLHRSMFFEETRIMAETGSRILLTGFGGDEVVDDYEYFQDLTKRGHLPRLVRDGWVYHQGSIKGMKSLLIDSVRTLTPPSVRQVYRNIRRHTSWQTPEWANPELVRSFTARPSVKAISAAGFKSLTQAAVFEYVSSPWLFWSQDMFERRSAYQAFEIRHPFFDRPLIEYVLSIPFDQRFNDGKWKYLLKRGLAGDLPEELLRRQTKVTFESFTAYLLQRDMDKIKQVLFNEDEWKSEPYVQREKAVALFENFQWKTGENALGIRGVRNIIVLELFLRSISGYNIYAT